MNPLCNLDYVSWQPIFHDSAIGDCTFSCDGRRPRTERFGGGSTTRECIGCTGRKGWRCSVGGASDFEPKCGLWYATIPSGSNLTEMLALICSVCVTWKTGVEI